MALRLLLLASLIAPMGSAMAAQAPPPFTAHYELNKGPLTLGAAELRFERPTEDRYSYRLHTYAVGVTKLFYDSEIRELSVGEIRPEGFRPDRYEYDRRDGDKARHAELRFDWVDNEVVNDVGDHPWRMAIPDDALDRVVSPLQLMHDLAQSDDASFTYRIADGGELKTYELHREGREVVSTPAGRFETVKVVRRDEDGERETRLWCAPALGYLAVKVEQWDEDDGTFVLLLTALEGLSLQEARLEPEPTASGHQPLGPK